MHEFTSGFPDFHIEITDLLDSLGAIEVDRERLDDVLGALAESEVVDREGPATAAD